MDVSVNYKISHILTETSVFVIAPGQFSVKARPMTKIREPVTPIPFRILKFQIAARFRIKDSERVTWCVGATAIYAQFSSMSPGTR